MPSLVAPFESKLGRIAACALASSMVFVFCFLLFATAARAGILHVFGAPLALAIVYAALLYFLTTIGNHPAPRRLRIWQVSLAVHLVMLFTAYAYVRHTIMLVLLLPEILSALIHLFGIRCAFRSARGA